MFDNKERTRYYGLRVGDFVEEHNTVGKVVALGPMDNNRVQVKKADGEVVPCVAEWCKIIQRVEEWFIGNQPDSIITHDSHGFPEHDVKELTDYYGGHLVAESVPAHFRSLILAAPDLYKALKWIHEIIGTAKDGGRAWCAVRDQPGAQEFARIMEAAIKKAETK